MSEEESIIEHIMNKHGFCYNDGNLTALREFESLVRQDATKNIRAVKESIMRNECRPYFGSEGVGITNRGRELWNSVLADLKNAGVIK
jgi:hypothetical protein